MCWWWLEIYDERHMIKGVLELCTRVLSGCVREYVAECMRYLVSGFWYGYSTVGCARVSESRYGQ